MDLPAEPVTLTLNPAIDLTVFLDRLVVGAVNRTLREHRQAGGKGVNVSALLAQYGISNTACGFLGRDNPQLFEELFRQIPVRDAFIRIPGATRTGIKLIDEATAETTDFNFPGLQPADDELHELIETLRGLVQPGRWFVLGGRLPAGVTCDDYANLIAMLKAGGAQVAADTSGTAFQTAIAGGVDLIKPNIHELVEFVGHELPDFAARIAAARDLQHQVPHVILSLGGEGAIFATPDATLLASAPPVQVMSTVGAGDALLAGYLAGLLTGQSVADCARLACVFAWAALEDVSRQLPDAAEIRRRMPAIALREF